MNATQARMVDKNLSFDGTTVYTVQYDINTLFINNFITLHKKVIAYN